MSSQTMTMLYTVRLKGCATVMFTAAIEHATSMNSSTMLNRNASVARCTFLSWCFAWMALYTAGNCKQQ
jgi:hypothetical protein